MGLLIERLALRPLYGQPILSLIIVTLMVATLIQGIMQLVWGPETLAMPRMFPAGGVSLAGAVLSYEHILFLAVSILVVGALLLFFRFSRVGMEMMAVAVLLESLK